MVPGRSTSPPATSSRPCPKWSGGAAPASSPESRPPSVARAILATGLPVIGMDNDELLCDLAGPPLSSVALGAERGGYEAAALRFIRDNAGRPIQVRDVVRCVGRSRRSLEIRFRRPLGMTPSRYRTDARSR